MNAFLLFLLSFEETKRRQEESRGRLEVMCLYRCLLKHLMDRRFLREGGREFQIDDPENARLVLYRSVRGRGGMKLFKAYLLVDLVNSE